MSFEKKLKHLDFIQNAITRMNTNSFIIKGWVITLTAAILGIYIKEKVSNLFFISIYTTIIFWALDGFYLSVDRKYRSLYDDVVKIDEESVDFSMKTEKYDSGRNTWLSSVLSRTIICFYGFILVLICLTKIFLA